LKDGGMLANNPVKIAYIEARNVWRNKKINFILSLGTGYFESEENPGVTNDNPSISQDLSTLVKELTKIVTDSQRIHEEFLEEIKINNYDFDYFRLNITLEESIPLSEIDPKKLEFMQKLVQEYCINHSQLIDTIANKIASSV
jgi:Fe-S-cluster formation regulator IscX/YfhJ